MLRISESLCNEICKSLERSKKTDRKEKKCIERKNRKI